MPEPSLIALDDVSASGGVEARGVAAPAAARGQRRGAEVDHRGDDPAWPEPVVVLEVSWVAVAVEAAAA